MNELFLKYLIRDYKVVSDRFGFIVKYKDEPNSIDFPLTHLNLMLGFDANENHGIYERWFSQERVKLSQHFVDYIIDYMVVISKTGWDAVNIGTNKMIDSDQVIIDLEEYYSPEMNRMLFNSWKSDEIIKVSERIMNYGNISKQ